MATPRGYEHPARPGAAPWCHAGQVTDFTHQDLSGARFEYVYLTGADFHGVDLTGARFRLVDLTRVTIRGADLRDMDISGKIGRASCRERVCYVV